ncbi:MAG: hypothetical protein U0T83_01500 [Bacteriovoracaceae bacterium]
MKILYTVLLTLLSMNSYSMLIDPITVIGPVELGQVCALSIAGQTATGSCKPDPRDSSRPVTCEAGATMEMSKEYYFDVNNVWSYDTYVFKDETPAVISFLAKFNGNNKNYYASNNITVSRCVHVGGYESEACVRYANKKTSCQNNYDCGDDRYCKACYGNGSQAPNNTSCCEGTLPVGTSAPYTCETPSLSYETSGEIRYKIENDFSKGQGCKLIMEPASLNAITNSYLDVTAATWLGTGGENNDYFTRKKFYNRVVAKTNRLLSEEQAKATVVINASMAKLAVPQPSPNTEPVPFGELKRKDNVSLYREKATNTNIQDEQKQSFILLREQILSQAYYREKAFPIYRQASGPFTPDAMWSYSDAPQKFGDDYNFKHLSNMILQNLFWPSNGEGGFSSDSFYVKTSQSDDGDDNWLYAHSNDEDDWNEHHPYDTDAASDALCHHNYNLGNHYDPDDFQCEKTLINISLDTNHSESIWGSNYNYQPRKTFFNLAGSLFIKDPFFTVDIPTNTNEDMWGYSSSSKWDGPTLKSQVYASITEYINDNLLEDNSVDQSARTKGTSTLDCQVSGHPAFTLTFKKYKWDGLYIPKILQYTDLDNKSRKSEIEAKLCETAARLRVKALGMVIASGLDNEYNARAGRMSHRHVFINDIGTAFNSFSKYLESLVEVYKLEVDCINSRFINLADQLAKPDETVLDEADIGKTKFASLGTKKISNDKTKKDSAAVKAEVNTCKGDNCTQAVDNKIDLSANALSSLSGNLNSNVTTKNATAKTGLTASSDGWSRTAISNKSGKTNQEKFIEKFGDNEKTRAYLDKVKNDFIKQNEFANIKSTMGGSSASTSSPSSTASSSTTNNAGATNTTNSTPPSNSTSSSNSSVNIPSDDNGIDFSLENIGNSGGNANEVPANDVRQKISAQDYQQIQTDIKSGKFNSNSDDSLFLKLSKAYNRSAYPIFFVPKFLQEANTKRVEGSYEPSSLKTKEKK